MSNVLKESKIQRSVGCHGLEWWSVKRRSWRSRQSLYTSAKMSLFFYFESLADKESQPSPASMAKMLLIFAHFWMHISLLLGHWYEIMALYNVKSILTEISASRQDRRVLQKSKIIRIEFLSKWGMLQTSRYV